ncbi:MAG: PQQ-dependent sugar dehydrogenase [Betaproteobacteria bacterium]|nr:MAG: PQQ-dependent sugar dehydrogenase [Betaproteobacteria bacterium]
MKLNSLLSNLVYVAAMTLAFASPVSAQRTAKNVTTEPKAVVFAQGLVAPWGMAVLPDGRVLVTQKSGEVRSVSADGKTLSAPLSGVPNVVDAGQGGLLGLALDPDFATQPWVYLSFSEADPTGGLRSGTAVFRARLQGNALVGGAVIFRMNEKVASNGHFGSRIVFARDKTMFVTLGDRQARGERGKAQQLDRHHGKVIRINRDGSIPADNPYVVKPVADALPELWSYGHRNPQGAALHPTTGELWVSEHGPQGGDEINIARATRNYGWPEISWGCEYGTSPIEKCIWAGGTTRAGMEQPITYWRPESIAPSGMIFYTGDKFPQWKGSLFVGALSGNAGGRQLWRLTLKGDTVVAREALFANLGERIRDVAQSPDGDVLLLSDSGKIFRVQR